MEVCGQAIKLTTVRAQLSTDKGVIRRRQRHMKKQSGLIPTMPWLTNILYELGHYEEAIEAYEQAISLDPNDAWTHNDKGSALYSLGYYEAAIEACKEAIRLDPNDAVAYHSKGSALYSLRHYEAAIEAY